MALIVALLVPFAACKKHKKGEILSEGKYEFYGLVDNKEPIVMEIKVDDDGQIKGKYGVGKDDDKIAEKDWKKIRGSVFDKNKVTLFVTDGDNNTIETWNVFAVKDDDEVVLEGTINDSKKNKILNVKLTTDDDGIDSMDVKAPQVAEEDKAAEEPKAEAKEKPEKVEEPKILNDSPYAIAPGKHTFNGKAEGKYPIVVYLTVSGNGSVSGKMAYKSTLSKYGNKESSYMYLSGYLSGNSLTMSCTSTSGSSEDWDIRVSDDGKKYKLNGMAYNYSHGKSFSISVSGK